MLLSISSLRLAGIILHVMTADCAGGEGENRRRRNWHRSIIAYDERRLFWHKYVRYILGTAISAQNWGRIREANSMSDG